MILKATSKTVDVFQSSDGESIPFGNNWIHKIEENLNKTKIMLVFISPRSILSSWIYFESGFAYAKEVKVIPIGIDGIDVGRLKPPLNLLQGFNISNADGINNIIAILNREFECSFEESYVQKDYDDLAALNENDSPSNIYAMDSIDYIQLIFPSEIVEDNNDKFAIVNEPLKVVEKYLESENVMYQYSDPNKIHMHGMLTYNSSKNNDMDGISIRIDPYSFSYNVKLINDLCSTLYEEGKLKRFWGNVVFNNGVELETTDFKVSSKLHKFGFEMSSFNGKYYQYESVNFTLQRGHFHADQRHKEKDYLRIIFDAGKLGAQEILDLISKLILSKVIKI